MQWGRVDYTPAAETGRVTRGGPVPARLLALAGPPPPAARAVARRGYCCWFVAAA